MTNSSNSDTGLDATFEKLRRCSYEQACVEYTMATLHLSSGSHRFQLAEAADPALKTFGWTMATLFDESVRLAGLEAERVTKEIIDAAHSET